MGGKGKRRNYLLIKIEPIYLPLELKTQSMIHSIEEQKEKKKKKENHLIPTKYTGSQWIPEVLLADCWVNTKGSDCTSRA